MSTQRQNGTSFILQVRKRDDNCKFNPTLEAELAVLLFPYLTAHSKNDKNDIIGKQFSFCNVFAALELTHIFSYVEFC